MIVLYKSVENELISIWWIFEWVRRTIGALRPAKVDAGHQEKLLVERLIKLAESVDSLLIDFRVVSSLGFALKFKR